MPAPPTITVRCKTCRAPVEVTARRRRPCPQCGEMVGLTECVLCGGKILPGTGVATGRAPHHTINCQRAVELAK